MSKQIMINDRLCLLFDEIPITIKERQNPESIIYCVLLNKKESYVMYSERKKRHIIISSFEQLSENKYILYEEPHIHAPSISCPFYCGNFPEKLLDLGLEKY